MLGLVIKFNKKSNLSSENSIWLFDVPTRWSWKAQLHAKEGSWRKTGRACPSNGYTCRQEQAKIALPYKSAKDFAVHIPRHFSVQLHLHRSKGEIWAPRLCVLRRSNWTSIIENKLVCEAVNSERSTSKSEVRCYLQVVSILFAKAVGVTTSFN